MGIAIIVSSEGYRKEWYLPDGYRHHRMMPGVGRLWSGWWWHGVDDAEIEAW